MKFLCDVHISYKISNHLKLLGFVSVHVNEILNKWFTSDTDISNYADENDFIVISKDSDFRDSYYIKQSPKKLIKINLGNISTTKLIQTFTDNITLIEKLKNVEFFIIEIHQNRIDYNL